MSNRMYPRALAVVTFAALALGAATGSASDVQKEDSGIHQGSTVCTPVYGQHTLGKAIFSFGSGKIRVEANIKHGQPSTHYTIVLLDADTCSELPTPGNTVKTNGKGKGRRTVSASAGSLRSFMIDAYDVDHGLHNVSDTVTFN